MLSIKIRMDSHVDVIALKVINHELVNTLNGLHPQTVKRQDDSGEQKSTSGTESPKWAKIPSNSGQEEPFTHREVLIAQKGISFGCGCF